MICAQPEAIAYQTRNSHVRQADDSKRIPDHHQPDLLDRAGRAQAPWTDLGAVHDRTASEQPVRIVQVFEALLRGLIPTVDDETVCLNEPRRTDKFLRIPPRRGALTGAARTQDAFV